MRQTCSRTVDLPATCGAPGCPGLSCRRHAASHCPSSRTANPVSLLLFLPRPALHVLPFHPSTFLHFSPLLCVPRPYIHLSPPHLTPSLPFISLFPSFSASPSSLLFSLSSPLFPPLQPCVAALRGTLCCPPPLSAALRVLQLWRRLFLSSSTTTTLYYPHLPTNWQVHSLLYLSCLPPLTRLFVPSEPFSSSSGYL